MTDYLEALLALLEEREEDREEDRETPKLREEFTQHRGGASPRSGAGTGSKARREERSVAEERPAGGGDGEAPFRSGKSAAEERSATLHGETAGEFSALLRREAAERRPAADALFRAVEEAASALERGVGTNRKEEGPDTAGGGAARPGTDGWTADGSGVGRAGDAESGRRTAGVWSGGDSPGRRTTAEEQSAARAAAERRERTAVGALERKVAAGLDRREIVPKSAAGGGPVAGEEELLSLEELDRQVRRDARRYDGTLSLY